MVGHCCWEQLQQSTERDLTSSLSEDVVGELLLLRHRQSITAMRAAVWLDRKSRQKHPLKQFSHLMRMWPLRAVKNFVSLC